MCILRVGEFIFALMGPEQVSKDVKHVTGASNELSDLVRCVPPNVAFCFT